MAKMIGNMSTWFMESVDKVFRYSVIRREGISDGLEFDPAYCCFCKIEEAVDLGFGEWLLGFREIVRGKLTGDIRYYRLSEIRLSVYECDQGILSD